jgi:CDGSH-type Zn-finger protein
MPFTADPDILAALLAKVEETKRAYEKAKDAFWTVAGKSTRLPHPDGTHRVHGVVAAETFALKSYTQAVQQLNRYLLDGTIPDEVRPKARTADPN